MTPLRIRSVKIHQLAIPLRLRFEHAAATRDTADPIIVQLGAGSPYAHVAGFGETLARTYVTGESVASVVEDITHVFAPRLAAFTATSFPEALEFIEALPVQLGGRIVTAARTAVELALLDLAGRVYRRRLADIVGWMGLPGFGPPGCLPTARYSGVVVGHTRAKVAGLLRLQRLYGLRDFKLKVAVEGWEERLGWARAVLRRGLEHRRLSLRVDANAGWSAADASEALPILEQGGVCAVEQPLSDADDEHLPWLAEQTRCALIVDESLLTIRDAERLIHAGGVDVLNIRIAKNGGLMPALRIARLALTSGLEVQLGCLVGETSVLTAAGIGFLEACPKVRFVEGAFGRLLLRRDIVRRPLRFGYRGRVRPLRAPGLGVEVDPQALEELAAERPRVLSL
ncbi:MAG: enolase C-terminal domain-like protein [Phycisphaerae bacterium]|jgi:muconate cycloisomerase